MAGTGAVSGIACYTSRMGLFSRGKRGHSVALIDIGSSSVGGALAHFADGQQPVICHTGRIGIEKREGEPLTTSMLRALHTLSRLLVEHGAPALRAETGSGRIERILASVASPWQETTVTSRHLEAERPFLFTRSTLARALAELPGPAEGRIDSGRQAIATILNGYETGNPFGKRARRADLVMLSSTLEKAAANGIEETLRHAFHAHGVETVAFAPTAYAVFRDLYPHQKEFVMLDVTGAATDAAFVKQGRLAQALTLPAGLDALGAGTKELMGGSPDAERAWVDAVRAAFAEFAARNALPHAVFLLADGHAQERLKLLLEGAGFFSRLSEEPLSVIPVVPSHFARHMKTRAAGEPDPFLALLALYYRKRLPHPAVTVEGG